LAIAALFVGVTTLSACEDDGGGPFGMDDFMNVYIDILCDKSAECPEMMEDQFLMAHLSRSGCEAWLRQAVSLGLSNPTGVWRAAEAAGTASWNEDRAGTCAELARSASCDDFDDFDSVHPECVSMMDGRVAAGGTCRIDEECRDGWCNDSDACPGRCAAYIPAGSACTAAGAVCAPGNDCVEGTCRAATPEARVGADAACDESEGPYCRSGLFCNSSGVCAAYLGEGAVCEGDPEGCRPGTICAEASTTCVRVTMVSTAGGACSQTAVCDPLASLVCDPSTHVCIALPPAGQPCFMLGGAYGICGVGAYCDAGTCRTKKADGSACAANGECGSGDCTGGTCRSAYDACGSGW
jgi:hypothetical protein